MMDEADIIYIQGVAYCKVCKRLAKPLYDNVGFTEQPYYQFVGFEKCDHNKND